VPRLTLGVCSLAEPVRTTRDRQLEVASRFAESESLAVALVKAVAAGAEALLVPPTPAVRAALGELDRDLPLLARVPHPPLTADLHDEPFLLANDVLGPARAWLPSWLEGGLASIVRAHVEREVAVFRASSLSGVVLPAVVTDLALCGADPRVIERLGRFASQRGWLLGLETRHLGHLLPALARWGVAPDFVLGPVNPRGVGMFPDAATTRAAIAGSGVNVVATEVRAAGLVPLAEGVAHARSTGAWGSCVELVDLDDVPRELATLAGAQA
jgi:hypothetical protein